MGGRVITIVRVQTVLFSKILTKDMMIIICASISAIDDVLRVKKLLEEKNYTVEIPEGIKNEYLRSKTNTSHFEKAEEKIKGDVLNKYFEKIKRADIVLVVNPKKNGIEGYIGANTLIEMAFAHVLNKRLYVLYSIPNIQYQSEILATKPIILNGSLEKIKQL